MYFILFLSLGVNIILFSIFIFNIKGNKYTKKIKEATRIVAKNLAENNNWFEEKERERKNKYLEEELKNKLEMEKKIKEIDEETLRKIKKNINKKKREK